jgi:hypothetical protein
MKIEIEVTEQRIADLLCAGMEGGINYWARIIEYHEPPALTFRAYPDLGGGSFPHVDYPLNYGGSVLLESVEGDVNGETRFTLTRGGIERGIVTMQRVAPRHFANWLAERDDAETGDVFIQCCLFGRVVFG